MEDIVPFDLAAKEVHHVSVLFQLVCILYKLKITVQYETIVILGIGMG